MKKICFVLLAAAITGLISTQAYAWAFAHHPMISVALGASIEANMTDDPDYWNENHLSHSLLASKARAWAKEAAYTPWWDFLGKPKRAAYALHYMEDCAQPWHAVTGSTPGYGVGGNDHLLYETWSTVNFSSLPIVLGTLSPVYMGSYDDVDDKAYALMNEVDDNYKYLNTPIGWVLNAGKTDDCLYKLGRYCKGLLNYIY